MSKYTPEQLDSIFEQIKEIIRDAPKVRAIKLRSFIDELYPREEEISKIDFADLKDRIRKIQEYLGIDFKLDQRELKQDDLDYCFIHDNPLREKATAYYREMLRYEYATRNHKRCFGEFCRLAIIQVELMLNYFFADERKFDLVKNEIDKIVNRDFNNDYNKWLNNNKRGIKPVEQKYKDQMYNDKKGSVIKLTYTTKFNIFRNKYHPKTYINKYNGNNSLTSLSIWISDVRHRKSHGGSTSIDPYEGNYLTEEELSNLDNWKNELIGKVEEFNDTHEKQIKFDNNQLSPDGNNWTIVPSDIRELYNSYNRLCWIFNKPFEDVHSFLRIVAATCAKELGKSE